MRLARIPAPRPVGARRPCRRRSSCTPLAEVVRGSCRRRLIGVRSTPIIANCVGQQLAPGAGCRAPASAGAWSDRRVAPKITSAQGGACRAAASASRPCHASCSPSLRRLHVAAELLAHRRQHLLGEGVVLARAEAGVERRGQHLGRHRLLDRRLDRPAALAGILDVAGEARQRRRPRPARSRSGRAARTRSRCRAARPRRCRPGRARSAGSPASCLRVDVAQDVEALGIGLHHAVFDAVVDHLDEMPGAGRAAVEVALLGARVAALAARASRRSSPRPGRQRLRRSGRGGRPLPCRRRSSCNSRAPGPRRRRWCRRRRSGCPSACSIFGAADVVLEEASCRRR